MKVKLGVLCAAIVVFFSPQATAEIHTFGEVHYIYGDSALSVDKTLTLSLHGEMVDHRTLEIVEDPEPIIAVFGVYAKAADGSFVPFPNQDNPLKPLQLIVGGTPISIMLPLSVDLFLKQETIPEGYNACFAEDYYHPISLPETITLVGRREDMQGLRVSVQQGGVQTEPAANVTFEVEGPEKTYTIRTDSNGVATLFPIPEGAYVIRQVAAQDGFSIAQSEINITVSKDEIHQLSVLNAQNGFLTLSPMGETLDEDLRGVNIPLERSYEVFDQSGKSFGMTTEDVMELPASVQGVSYTLRAADVEATDGFPRDLEEHSVLIYSGQQTDYAPVIQTEQGVFQLSHVSHADASPVAGGTFALYRENEPEAMLVFQADEHGQYTQQTPIDAGRYTLQMLYAADGFQFAEDSLPVEIKSYFQEDQFVTRVTWQSIPATKAYLDAPVVVSDTQAFPSLFETDAEIDFQLRTVLDGSRGMEITDVSIQMDEPDIRGIQTIEMRPDGADLLVKRRLGIPETEEFLALNVSGVVSYTVHYPVSPDQTADVQLQNNFSVTVATFAKIAERPQYALYGRILDKNGNPVEGFRVSRQDPTGKLLFEQTITDAFGAYAFFATSSDAHVVYHPDPGYGIYENENGGDAIMLRLQTLQGRVIDHGVLGDSMITLQIGHDEIIPDVDGRFSYTSTLSDDAELTAIVPDQAIVVIEETEGEILVHVYPASSIVGAVVDENGGLVVEGAIVTIHSTDGALAQETMTDSSGTFMFQHLLPGDYQVAFEPPEGYLLQEEESVGVSISAGEKRMLKRVNVIRPATITGSVQKEDGTPMEGVEIVLKPSGAIAKTLPDGTFTFGGLRMDTYQLEVKPQDGYVLLELPEPVVLNFAGEHAEIAFRATESASISGRIWNNATGDGAQADAEGLPNAIVTLLTEQGERVASLKTDSDGAFSFSALRPDTYQISVELPSGMIFSTQDQALIQGVNSNTAKSDPITLRSGEKLGNLQCGAVVSGTLMGHVWSDAERSGQFTGAEPATPGVAVTLSQPEGACFTATTNEKGEYRFSNLRAGDYELTFELPDGHAFSDAIVWSEWGVSAPDTNEKTVSLAVSIEPGEASPVIDLPTLQMTPVQARVWADANLDGTDRDEEGVAGVPVRLFSLSDDERVLIGEQATDESGYALFGEVLPGDYALEYRLPDDSWGFVSGVEQMLSKNWAMGPNLSISAGKNMGRIGVGIAKLSFIKGTAFTDADYDGLRGGDETGLSATVTLYNEASEAIATTTTNRSDGAYSFDAILPGRYTLEFTLDNGYRFTRNRLDAPSFNSNVPEQAGTVGKTSAFFLPMGETVLINAGAYPASSISGAVWEDIYNTGQYAPGNPPIAGLKVTLVSQEQDVAETVTDKDGKYKFENLSPGTYLVRVELPDGIRFSTQTFATGHANNIQQTEITLGKTPRFYLPMGTDKTNVDAGAIYPGTMSGYALTPNGEGVSNVKVFVLRDDYVYAETVTDETGNYLFENLRSGKITLRFELPEGWLFAEEQTGEIPSVVPQGKRAEDVNITVFRETVVTGSVWLDENADGKREKNEKPLVGAVVALQQHASMEDAEGVILSITGTSVDGVYRFGGLQPGLYSVRIVPPEYTYLYGENALQSEIYSLKESETFTHDAPAFMAGYIRGKIYEDHDNDGQFSEGDIPMSEVSLALQNESGETVKEAVTDSDGNYLFNELQPGRYVVRAAVSDEYMLLPPAEGEAAFANDGETPPFDFAMGDMKNGVDAPLLRPSSVGDLVWLDSNGNGLQETNEPGIADIQVTLFKVTHGNMQQVAQTKTDEKGRYRFDQLLPGKYQLAFDIGDYVPTKPNESLPEINSKLPWVSKPTVNMEVFSVFSGVSELRMDAGLITHEMAEGMNFTISDDGRISAT